MYTNKLKILSKFILKSEENNCVESDAGRIQQG